jgi:hypothetical protein
MICTLLSPALLMSAVNVSGAQSAPTALGSGGFPALTTSMSIGAAASNTQSSCGELATAEQKISAILSHGGGSVSGPQSVTLSTSAEYTAAGVATSQPLIWSVNWIPGGDGRFGTITSNGLYSAPNNMPACATLVITALSPADFRIWKSKEITLETTTSGPAPIPTVVSTVPMGLVMQNPDIMGRDGTWSAAIKGKSYWSFNDTPMYHPNAEGENFISNTRSWTDNLDASNGINLNHDHLDSIGMPTEFMPFTADEIAFNTAHNSANGCTTATDPLCGEAYAIWPGPIMPVPDSPTGEAYHFYSLILRGGPIVWWEEEGIGIAKEENRHFTRPITTPGTAHPTLMWQGAVSYSSGGLVQSGYVYMSGGGQSTMFGYPICSMARAPLQHVLEPSAWTYYNANTQQWTADPTQATMAFIGGAGGNSMFFNPALNEYMVIYSQLYSDEVLARVSPTPWGPWSDEIYMFTGQPSINANGAINYAAQPHPEFQQQNGLVQFVTYVQDNDDLGWLGQDIQLERVTLAP